MLKSRNKKSKKNEEESRPVPFELIAGATTLWQCYSRILSAYADRNMIGSRKDDSTSARYAGDDGYQWTTYAEFGVRVRRFASGLLSCLELTSGTAVGICGENSEEWLVADWACGAASLVSVPLHINLSAGAFATTLSQARVECVVISLKMLERFWITIRDECPMVKHVVVIPSVGRASASLGFDESITVLPFGKVESSGTATLPCQDVDGDFSNRLSTVAFSSGSTSDPKGMGVTDGEQVVDLADVAQTWEPGIDPDPIVQLACFSFSYGLERDSFQTIALFGGQMALFSGNFDVDILHSLVRVRPTTILGVPALWNLLHCHFLDLCSTQARAIALDSIGSMFGERLTVVSSGTAPLSATVGRFMREAFPQRYIGEGYGTSETGLVTLNRVVQPGVQVTLRDVPELGFSVRDLPHPRGEVLVKTDAMASYFRDEERTAAAFTADGFFITGDVGVLSVCQEPGQQLLDIVDRIGSVFKLPSGEFVSPARLEDVYLSCPAVLDLFVYGKPAWECLLAVVRPSDAFRGTAQEMARALEECARGHHLPLHQRIRGVLIEDSDFQWAFENNMCTPSLKHVRRAFVSRYGEELEMLYEDQQKEVSWEDFVRRWFGLEDDSQLLWQSGADSVTAVQVASILRQRFAFQGDVLSFVLRRDACINTLKGARQAAVSASPSVYAREDMKIHFDAPTQTSHRGNSGAILVTGATGFVGSFLVRALLSAYPSRPIMCLVRQLETETRSARLSSRACHSRLMTKLKQRIPGCDLRRVQVVVGDLCLPHLGMKKSEFERAARQIELVVHCGGAVDWLRDYYSLRAANVLGTATLLGLQKPLLYISSGVVGGEGAASSSSPLLQTHQQISHQPYHAGVDDPSHPRFDPAHLSSISGYALTKGVAEFLCNRAAREVDAQVVIVRVGTVGAEMGGRQSGRGGAGDFVTRFFQTISQLNSFPRSAAVLEMIPVDYVARAAVHLLQNRHAAIPQHLFTLSNHRSWSYSDIGLSLQNQGGNRNFPVGENAQHFVERVRRNPACALYPLLQAIDDPDWWVEEPVYEDDSTNAALSFQCPSVDAPYIASLFQFARKADGEDG